MSPEKKQKLKNRLTRIQGQITGIGRMIEEDRYCVDILTQTRAITAALRAVEDQVMENHLNTCVTDAIRGSDDGERQDKIQEVLEVMKKFRKHG
jgi:DNA-binding FrmR family transcriptional regulator